MSLDPTTLFVVLLGFCAISGAGTFALWRSAPEETHFAYWSAGLVLGAFAVAGLALRGHIPNRLSIDGANLLALISLGLGWLGMRTFGGRRPDWIGFALPPLIWIVTCFIPTIYDSLAYRVAVASILSGAVALRMLLEVLYSRDRRLPGSSGVIFLCSFHIAIMAVRCVSVLLFGAGDGIDYLIRPLLVASLVEPLFVLFGVLVFSIMMTQHRRERWLQHKAATDPLTGLLNRGAFIEAASNRLARADEGNAIAVVVFDVDFFKDINDRFGHAAGDRVLVAFAEAALGSVRAADPVGRIGGEEFAILLDAPDHKTALEIVERVRSEFAQRSAGLFGPTMRVTASGGVAFVEGERDLDQLLLRADAALYAAKRSGRNKVRRAGDTAAA